MKKYSFLLLLAIIFILSCTKEEDGFDISGQGPIPGGDYYVAPWGDDNNPGSFELPWGTWQKAFNTAIAGDTVYFRGGVWYPTSFVIYHSENGHSGTYAEPICYLNYPGETPILDLSKYEYTIDAAGLDIARVTYLKFRGLTIRNNKQNVKGQWISGLQFFECGTLWVDQMTSYGHGGYGIWFYGYDTLYLTNCDSYDNIDFIATDPGNRADGFQISDHSSSITDTLKYTLITGCRAWGNSDDGMEISVLSEFEAYNNWMFDNGKLEYGAGVGFKYAWAYVKTPGKRRSHHNIAAFNKGPGFVDQNLTQSTYGPVGEFSNNTIYKCKFGFSSDPGSFDCNTGYANVIYNNNLVYSSTFSAYYDQIYCAACKYEYPVYTHYSINSFKPKEESPYWAYHDSLKVTDDDFESLDNTQLSRPRKADGSLPDITFMKLSKGSDLIDKGIDVGLLFMGHAPDLGAFEVE